MRRHSLVFSFPLLTAILTVCSPSAIACDSYSCDSLAVRAILDSNGLTQVPVEWVGWSQNGRIVGLSFTTNHGDCVVGVCENAGCGPTVYGGRPMRCLPSQIGDLDSLREIRIGTQYPDTTDSIHIDPAILGLSALRRIELTAGLRTFPSIITSLTALTYLNLSGNFFTALPLSIGDLRVLNTLGLGGNLLTSLPATIGRLRALRVLSVSRNALATLPDSIGLLDSLEYLGVVSNRLTTLPPSMAGMRQLRFLVAGDNPLTTVSSALAGLAGLTGLSLSQTRLRQIPAEVFTMTGLEILAMSDDSLTHLPPAIGAMQSLRCLNLENNQLRSLPQEVLGLNDSIVAKLSRNRLCDLPPDIGVWLDNHLPAYASTRGQICDTLGTYVSQGNPNSTTRAERGRRYDVRGRVLARETHGVSVIVDTHAGAYCSTGRRYTQGR